MQEAALAETAAAVIKVTANFLPRGLRLGHGQCGRGEAG